MPELAAVSDRALIGLRTAFRFLVKCGTKPQCKEVELPVVRLRVRVQPNYHCGLGRRHVPGRRQIWHNAGRAEQSADGIRR